ncbi:hypothetical protein ACIOJE_16060 [Kitasatospora sp. NPDC087861]|uniref:hypothetical protein n=1 Tax=Kitasatospora sp. NPDC087861 TaxID=3364070 RepID=UPI003815D353
MDPDHSMRLIRTAIIEGVCPEEIEALLKGDTILESSPVNSESLRRTYTRRLLRSPTEARHLAATRALVDFLSSVDDPELSMITVDAGDRGYEMFLADAEETRIQFWMSMFSRPATM